MCGIAGIYNLDNKPISAVILKRMSESIAHRGPDGEGHYIDGSFGLGHRRLAILDLSPAGQQPMQTADSRFVICYNGEVYNYRELRTELQSLGHQFRSQTDTEVVLAAYVQWGARALDRLNGMFAFAVWDKKTKMLFLARDRYGIKPLYYTLQKNVFLFGSEIKAILAHPAYQTEINREALLEYFTFQNFFNDRTLFKDVRLLPQGTFLRIPHGTQQLPSPQEYWDYDFVEPNDLKDETEYIEELDRLIRQAVNRQLVSDVEVGSYLSGGMDTGTLTALAAAQLPYLKTFTCGFDLQSASGLEMGFDERKQAEYMSYLFKTEHYEMVLKAGDMERVLDDLTWHLEEPRVGQSYPNYYIARLAGKFLKVILSGTGGDELFGGYPWRYYRTGANENFEHYIDEYYQYWQRLIPNRVIQKVFQPIWSDVKHVWTRDLFRDVFKHHPDSLSGPEDCVNHSLYFEAKTFLHSLLVVEDKLSMAHGLEVRVPFLDNDLVDFAMRVPVKYKLANLTETVRFNANNSGLLRAKNQHKFRDGKMILRNTMGRYIPEKVTKAAKQGFSAPDASWFAGESIEYVKSFLYNPHARIYDYLDQREVQTLVDDHLEGRQNRRLLIWSLLSFEHWCNAFLAPRQALPKVAA